MVRITYPSSRTDNRPAVAKGNAVRRGSIANTMVFEFAVSKTIANTIQFAVSKIPEICWFQKHCETPWFPNRWFQNHRKEFRGCFQNHHKYHGSEVCKLPKAWQTRLQIRCFQNHRKL